MLCPNPVCPDQTMFGVRGEYGPGITTCPKCGSGLVEEVPVEDAEPEIGVWVEPEESGEEEPVELEPLDEAMELVEIMSCDYRHEAEMVQGFLEARGIAARIASDDCGSVHPILGFARTTRIEVREQDVEAAIEMVEAFERQAEMAPGQLAEDESRDQPDVAPPPEEPDDPALEEIRALARRARRAMYIGLLAVPIVVEPLAVWWAVKGLRRHQQLLRQDPRVRRSLVRTAWGAGVLAIVSWIWFWFFLVG